MADVLSAAEVAAIAEAERLLDETRGLPLAERCGESDDCACCFCREAIYTAGFIALQAERDAARQRADRAAAALAAILADAESWEVIYVAPGVTPPEYVEVSVAVLDAARQVLASEEERDADPPGSD